MSLPCRNENVISENRYKNNIVFLKKCSREGVNDKIECIVCGAVFSIENGGQSAIKQHLDIKRHKSATSAPQGIKINDFFSLNTFGSNEKCLAVNEGTFAYHICKHSKSFRSTSITSNIIRKLYDKKFSCGPTKTKSIIFNVLAPFANEILK
jgi:hypothetical protein